MAYIRFRLDDILRELQMNPNQLAIEAKLLPPTVYNIYKSEASRVHLDTLAKILVEVNRIAKDRGLNRTYTLSDLMEFIDK